MRGFTANVTASHLATLLAPYVAERQADAREQATLDCKQNADSSPRDAAAAPARHPAAS